MPRGTFDYMAGGADDEVTLRDNVDAWTRMRLRPRVLRDVSTVSTTTSVLGTDVSSPVLVAPVSYLRLVHEDGERAMAAGAAAAGTLMTLSTRSSCTIEEVAAAAPGAPRWFQVYVLRDRAWTADLVDRAVASGFGALVLTVDTPVLGYRRRDVVNAFELPEGITMANVASRVSPEVAEAEGLLAAYQAPDLGPADLAWLAERSGLPVVAKGVLTAEAARECVDAGASAVVVSNHGGRQLDGVLATADALAAVADAVGADVEVYVDGGVRRGTDVLKALALGARAVMVGRPVVWGLATSGAEGVEAVLGHLSFELGAAMALAGVRSPAEVDRGMVDLRSHQQ
jgi:4-hydroxymandelate oxidase